MPVEATEIRIVFKRPPRLGIGGRMVPDPDELIIRIKPDPGAELCLIAKKAGEEEFQRGPPRPRSSRRRLGTSPSPTSACSRDALRGDRSAVPDATSIEETWRIVQPLLDDPPPVETYEPGTWGPESASHLLTVGHGAWRKPWLPR